MAHDQVVKGTHGDWTFTLPDGTTGRCTLKQGSLVLSDGPCRGEFTYDLSNVTDGSYTEVLRGDLPEGAPLVVGGGPRAGAATDANAPASGTRPRPPRMF